MMNVRELKEIIKDLPGHMDVFIHQENQEFNLSLLEKAEVIEAHFSEDTGPVLATDIVLRLTD